MRNGNREDHRDEQELALLGSVMKAILLKVLSYWVYHAVLTGRILT